MANLTEQRVTISGGAGFLGTHVAAQLRQRGIDPFIVHHCDYDLRDLSAIRRMLADARPDVVIHLAGRVGGIGLNQKHPAQLFYDNLIMGVQLMHESYVHGVKKFVTTGTVCSFPRNCPVPFAEEDLWNGYPEPTNAPYGLAKKSLLVQSQAYRKEYGFNAIYLLPVNLYGIGDNFNDESSHVIPSLIKKFTCGDPVVELWGDGTPTREFLWVEDCAEAIVLATEKYDSPEPMNLGSLEEISMKDLAELIARLTNFRGKMVWNPDKPNGQPRRKLNTLRAQKALGWCARTGLEQGLRQVIRWYVDSRKAHWSDEDLWCPA